MFYSQLSVNTTIIFLVVTQESSAKVDNTYPEISCLIWLDPNANDKDSRGTESKLVSLISDFKKFTNVPQCQKYIKEQSQEDWLVMVVSGQLGQMIVPSIHHLKNIVSIYVYCMNKEKNEEWARSFAKVRLNCKSLISTQDFFFVER